MLVFDVHIADVGSFLNGISWSRLPESDVYKAPNKWHFYRPGGRADDIADLGGLRLLTNKWHLVQYPRQACLEASISLSGVREIFTGYHYGSLFCGDQVKASINEKPKYGLHVDFKILLNLELVETMLKCPNKILDIGKVGPKGNRHGQPASKFDIARVLPTRAWYAEFNGEHAGANDGPCRDGEVNLCRDGSALFLTATIQKQMSLI